jgi:hypothetical protein
LADKPSAFNREGLLGATTAKPADWLTAVVHVAHRYPGRVLTGILTAHLVIWTLLPIPLSPNLQLDLAEGLALGKEWQVGYWKHPPLPWWLTDLIFQITGNINSVYLLGPLAAVVCMLGVYFLARDIVGPVQALIPVLALEGIHYYNFSAVKFAHDQMQLPIWAWAGFFLYRALTRGNALYWIGAGVMVALAFWTKYSAVVFGVSLGLFLILDPVARRCWRTPGPYLMGLAFAIVIAPQVLWLIDNFHQSPITYAELRARRADRWYEFLIFPIRWMGGQLFFLLPALVLLALAYGPRPAVAAGHDGPLFARRYVTTLAVGPFLLVTLSALVSGRLPVLLWGYPLWSFLPLAVMVWFGPVADIVKQKTFAFGFLCLFAAVPVLYAAVPIVESFIRDRTQAVQFPGQRAADYFTKVWRDKNNSSLPYVTGDELAANSIAVYSKDHPRVIVHGMPSQSPWIDMNDVRKKGVLIVWTESGRGESYFPVWKQNFGLDPAQTSVVELPMQSRRPKPLRLRYAIIPPQH